MTSHYGCLLREAREKKGISLRRLAKIMGISAPYLSDVERGRRGPLLPPRDWKIAVLLDLPYAQIELAIFKDAGVLYFATPGRPLAVEVGGLLALAWRHLSDAKLEKIRKVVES